MTEMGSRDLGRFARLVLDCITREFPYHIVHVMRGVDDVDIPRRMNPAFYGCYDWHSAVHSHWLLVRLPVDEPRRQALLQVAATHRREGIAAVTNEHYAGAHWLASFAIYLETSRGLASDD